jgi:hypothetical protein
MLQNQMQMGGVMGNMLAMMQVRSAATRNMLSHDSKILSLILALLALSAPFSARVPCGDGDKLAVADHRGLEAKAEQSGRVS